MKVQVKTRHSLATAAVVTAGIVITCFALVAWADGPNNYRDKFQEKRDTIPAKEKKEGSTKDFDRELRELDEAVEQLDELRKKDWDKMRADVEKSVKEIDLAKVGADLEQAISKIDMEKIGEEIEESLNKIDFEKIEKDIEAALDDLDKVDNEKLKRELQSARADLERQLKNKDWQADVEQVKKLNMTEVEEALKKATLEVTKAKENLNLEKFDLKETMAKAQVEVNKAKAELKGYQEMVYSMEKEGLLNTNKDYIIEYKDGEIFIDGKKQSAEVTAKYRKYFNKESVTIKKHDGDLDINVD